ncbi:GNAT family N-acetyltransferase [Candidatus Woesearchaeota archaeon]|nr:GNAT family N-acetyltransferase [Candidatus Woesearchaeota archaeon]
MYVDYIAVGSTLRKRGIANALLDYVIELEKPELVELFSLDSAIKFWKKWGFHFHVCMFQN